jgi:hypothetical protein
VENRTEIMQCVLKMQYIYSLLKYIKLIAWYCFLYVFFYVVNGEISLRRLKLSIYEVVTPREEEDVFFYVNAGF